MSSALNFGVFAHFTLLISRFAYFISQTGAFDSWDNIHFNLPWLFQEPMVFSGPQLAYLYYHEISLTVLQNYNITAVVNVQLLTPLKCQKVKKSKNIIDK